MLKDRLATAGVPFVYWGSTLEPGDLSTESREKVDALDPEKLYASGTNVLITSHDGGMRMRVPSILAQRFMAVENRYYRNENEHKRSGDDLAYLDGEVFTQPFKVRMLQTDELVDLWKACDRDDERSFTAEVTEADIFILTELGAEWASKFTAKIINEFLQDRHAEALPTIVTLAGKISEVMDKSGEYVYGEIAKAVKKWEQVVLK